MEEIIQFDKQLLLMVNGSDSIYLDSIVMTLTNAFTWIPLYVSLLFIVIKNSTGWRNVLLVVACAALCVLLAGTVDDEIVKPLVARWRATHDPQIGSLVAFYSLLICCTRLYLGVHYPGDITVGLLWGAIVGSCVYLFFRYMQQRMGISSSSSSPRYTSSGFEYRTIYVPLAVLALTYVYAFLKALV